MNLVKDAFYKEHYLGDSCIASMDGRKISMFGLTFEFDFEQECYVLADDVFTSVELV